MLAVSLVFAYVETLSLSSPIYLMHNNAMIYMLVLNSS
jgi:hypothetical protein